MFNPLSWFGEFVGFFTHPVIFWGWISTSAACGSVWWVSGGPLSWKQVVILLCVLAVVAIAVAVGLLSTDRYGTYTLAYLLLTTAITSLAWSNHYSGEAVENAWWSSLLLEVGAALFLGAVLDVVIIYARSNDRMSADFQTPGAGLANENLRSPLGDPGKSSSK